MNDIITLHLAISGIVQGVSYRISMLREAERLGLDGWVRNRRDGSVETVVKGREDAIAKLVEWAHRGPPSARVERVKSTPWEEEIAPGFRQAPTI